MSALSIDDAQADMRRAYVGGGPGVFVSGLVWLAAAVVEARQGVGTAFAVLFFGGMLIFPLAMLGSRRLFARPKEDGRNPFGRLALESTIAMLGGLFAAWLLLPIRPELVFPLSAVAVGTHYAVFRTVYGDRLFWLLGGLIAFAGFAAIYSFIPVVGGVILWVAVIEIVLAIILTIRALWSRGAA